MSITALFKQAAQRAQEEEKRRREAEKAALQRLLNQKKEQAQAKASVQRAAKQINQRISTQRPHETTETTPWQRFVQRAKDDYANEQSSFATRYDGTITRKVTPPKIQSISERVKEREAETFASNQQRQIENIDVYKKWLDEARNKGITGSNAADWAAQRFNLDPTAKKLEPFNRERETEKEVNLFFDNRKNDAQSALKIEAGNKKNPFVTGDATREEVVAYAEGWDKSFITEYRPYVNQEDVEKLSYLMGESEINKTDNKKIIKDLYNKIVDEAQQAYEDDRFASGDYVKSNYYAATPVHGAVNAWQGVLKAADRVVMGNKNPSIVTAEQRAYYDELSKAGGVKKLYGDTVFNIARMVAGGETAAFAASVAGNTYSEARREGRGDTESMVYAVLTAAKEVYLRKALGVPLGGIHKFVGKESLLKSAIAKASSNPTVHKAVGALGDMLGEGAEEYLQDVVDPIIRNMVFAENNKFTLLPEGGAYTFFVGALTAGVVNIGSYTSGVNTPEIKLKDGTIVPPSAIERVVKADETNPPTKEDIRLIAKLGQEATPEMLEQFAQEVDTMLEVDMGGKTLREIKQEANALPDEASKTDLYYRQINSPEFQEAARRYMQNSLKNNVENGIINQQNIEGKINEGIEETRAIDSGRTAVHERIEPDRTRLDKEMARGRVLGQRDSVIPEASIVSESTKQYAKEKTGRDFLSVFDSTMEYERYSAALQEAIDSNEHGSYVSPQSADDLKTNAKRTFLTPDNNAGIVVFKNGDIGALFKNPNLQQRKVSFDLVLTALEHGGNKLDNYDGFLTSNYTQLGFIPVARVAFNEQYAPENWNYEKFGKPDVIFFMHNGDSAATVAQNYMNYTKIDTSTLPLFDDYDKAYAYRDNLIEEQARNKRDKNGEIRKELTSEEITAPIQDIETDMKVAENRLQAGIIPFNEAMQQLEAKIKVNNKTMTDWLTKQINQRSKKRNTEQESYTELRTREFADFLESARAYAEQQGMKQQETIAYLKRESQRYADETMLGIKERSTVWERTKEQRELNNALRKHLTQSESAQIEKGMDLYYRAFNQFNDMNVAQWSKMAKDLKTKHEKNLKKGRGTNLEKTARELQDSQRVRKLREEIDLDFVELKLTPLELKSVLARILVTDTGASIMDFDHDIYGKKDTQNHLYKEFDYMRRGRSAAETAVYTGQVNLEGRTVGESLNSIFKDLENKPYKHLVPDYMYHRHNVDRAGNSKGLFGKQFSPKKSTQIFKQMEAQYPELDGIAKRFYKFFGNNLEMVAESGLITQDLSDLLEAMYQSYIPVERDLMQEIELPAGTVIDLNNPQYEQRKNIGQVIKRATESDLPLINFREAMIRQTKRVYTQSYRNVFANKLLDAVWANMGNSKIGKYVYGTKVLAEGEAATNVPSIVFYRNGQRVQMFLSQPMHDAFTNLVDQSNRFRPVTNAFEAFTNTFKKLVTSYNPTFFVSNFTKDMGDAMIYSKNPPHIFLKNVSNAPYDMATKTQMWQDYVNSGSFGSSMFDYLQSSGLKKFGRGAIGVMEKGNFYIEQVPRFAEYKSTMEALQPKIDGGEISWRDAHVQAMYNSADVTVNFARSGKATKFLNRTFVPFLNPSVQGVSKMVRNITEIGSPKAALSVILKGAIFGFGAVALNYLIYDDDDDFKQLSDYKKRNFYLIKKKDGTFIAIPKGRVSSVIGETLKNVFLPEKGEPFDWAEFVNWAWNQVGVESPVTSHILSPFFFAKQNKTWYGSDIESKYDQNKPEGERYDETTDAISKFIGGKLNISPKKINYILTSYGGVITDLLLPPITPATSGGNAWEYITSPWERRFTADPVMNSGISGKFYTEFDKAERLKNAQNAPNGAEYQYKYLDQQRWAVQDVYKEINAIENDSSLSLKEKGDRIKALRGILNVHFAQTLEDFEKVKEASKYYTVTGDEQKDKKHYADMIYEVFGAEKALQSYSKGVYEDATDYAQFGISFDDYYDFYFLTKDIDAKDADGISVTNLKKERIYNVIESMDIPKEHKMLLFMKTYGSDFSEEERAGLLQQLDSLNMTKEDKFLLGVKMNIIRTPRTKQGKLEMLNYIETLNMTKEEKYALANKLKLITRSL